MNIKKKQKKPLFPLIRFRLMHVVILCCVIVMTAKVNRLRQHIWETWDLDLSLTTAETSDALPGPINDPKPGGKAYDFDPLNLRPDEFKALNLMAERHKEFHKEEDELPAKEEMLKAIEKRLDEKTQQLSQLKDQLQKLLDSIEEKENVNTGRLVKMAETMDAPKASKILEGVEFSLLLEIMEKMSEKKASAILASMPPEKASYLMTELAKRKKLIKKDGAPVPAA